MHPMLNIAVRAARNAGNIIMRYADRLDTLAVTSKARNDFVTDVDRMAEQEIISVLRKSYPDHGILAEETGSQGASEEFCWVIDPLDGTTNYIRGFPQFAVSIAFKQKGRLEQGVIYDPVRQELYTASRGAGAQLNNRRIRVSPKKDLEGALLGTGFPFKQQEHLDAYLEMFKALFPDTAGIRRAGAASLDLAYVAAGRLDGFWEMGLSEWDMAAGVLLIKEAGGIVTNLRGDDSYLKTGNIIAGTPKIHHAVLRRIQNFIPEKIDIE
ncbi:MAG TPA: inositol-1-monophosphatase [Gammaproteobacteria bacterium]|nr:inositol-1-monophosphatase [Gammaproteobacteria bacterium]